MREIAKGQEPPSLTVHRQTPHSDYDNYAEKGALRQALVTEQRGLCCYCMSRIRGDQDSMKIEHWQSQRRFRGEQLSYRNLLGACLGGHGQPYDLQHCDTRKGDRDLRWNPADPNHHIETRLQYELDGTIRSGEPEYDAQLNDVLKLNLVRLKNNRKGVLDGVLAWWRNEKNRGPVPRDRLDRERGRRVDGTGVLEPFCQVAIWWLDQRLSRMAS